LAFKGSNLLVSPNLKLIQAGKAVSVFGEKITGLGKKNMEFGDGTVLQQVMTGFKSYTFVDELTLQPFLINDESPRMENATKFLKQLAVNTRWLDRQGSV